MGHDNAETQAFKACPLSEARAGARAFVFSRGPPVTCFAFPSKRLRAFGTWFFQREWELLFTNCLLEANTGTPLAP